MQLINSLPNSLFEQFPSTLVDIVNNLEIKSNFCIVHPQYESLELSEEIATKLSKLSTDIQHKYLRIQLESFLYNIYYTGKLKYDLVKSDRSSSSEYRNTIEGEQALFDELHKSNCGQGYLDPGWQVIREENDNLIFVYKDNLTLEIDRDRYLDLAQRNTTIGDRVAVKMPRNLIEREFYVAVGNAGIAYLNEESLTTNIYFNINAEGAIAITKRLTQQLNKIGIPFTFKVLYDPDEYPRYDAGILNFKKKQYIIIKPILESIYREYHSCFGTEIPLLTRSLAPGLSLAEEPDNKKALQDGFGKHRCQIVAGALQQAWQSENNSVRERIKFLWQDFSTAAINLNFPYLNANSQDIYLPLEKL
jgi:hypothetical protein